MITVSFSFDGNDEGNGVHLRYWSRSKIGEVIYKVMVPWPVAVLPVVLITFPVLLVLLCCWQQWGGGVEIRRKVKVGTTTQPLF